MRAELVREVAVEGDLEAFHRWRAGPRLTITLAIALQRRCKPAFLLEDETENRLRNEKAYP